MHIKHGNLLTFRKNLFPHHSCILLYSIVLSSVICFAGTSSAQMITLPDGREVTIEEAKKMAEQYGGRRSRPMPVEQPQPEIKKEEKKEKPEEKKNDEKKEEEGVKTISRPTGKSTALDPNRDKLKIESGRIQFSYFDQPWEPVLQDYADAANLSFDWQKLPADNLNLVTQRKYTLKEARDVLNRHLLSRGFTLIVQGELMSAVEIKQLDPSMIPRVEADDLEDYAPYDFVRVQFQLPITMEPDKVKDDVKSLLSPNGKVTPLLATRRLLVIDAVANLRNVRSLVYAEQMASDSVEKPFHYKVKYRRADYIADQIMIVLGRDPASRKTPMEMQLEQQRMQLLQQIQKKGKDVTKMLKEDGPPLHIAVNKRDNSLLINADPTLMPVIKQTINQLDVPEGGYVADSGEISIKKYNTVTISTDAVVSALKEIGNLSPRTQIQSDSSSKTIFASATARDHEKIQQMIDRLDGTGRRPEVIWLPPQLRADQVAGSIMALIVGPEKKEENNNRGRWFWGGRGRNNNDNDDQQQGFRILPDIENNRLLVWANDDELREVKNLIDALERNEDGSYGDTRKVRRFQARGPEETRRLLELLQKSWTGENELDIQLPSPSEENAEPDVEESADSEDKVVNRSPRSRFLLTQAVVENNQKAAERSKVSRSKDKVKVFVNDQGELVIASNDPEALNELERLMAELVPSAPEFHYFKLKYIYASTARLNLEEYFADEIAEVEDDEMRWIRTWMGTDKKNEAMTLGKRPPLRFIDDSNSNTLIAANASVSQLKVIEELLEIYDTPPEAEEYYSRETEIIPIKYSRARDISNSLKEVYRELLSSSDKEFDDSDGSGGLGGVKKSYVFGDAKRDYFGEKIPVVIRFEGALSIGVDEVSNTLIVSARAEILDSIKETVEILDQAAIPETIVHVHEIDGLMSAQTMQQALAKALAQPWPGGKPQSAQQNGQANNRGRGDQNRNRREGDRRRRRRNR